MPRREAAIRIDEGEIVAKLGTNVAGRSESTLRPRSTIWTEKVVFCDVRQSGAHILFGAVVDDKEFQQFGLCEDGGNPRPKDRAGVMVRV